MLEIGFFLSHTRIAVILILSYLFSVQSETFRSVSEARRDDWEVESSRVERPRCCESRSMQITKIIRVGVESSSPQNRHWQAFQIAVLSSECKSNRVQQRTSYQKPTWSIKDACSLKLNHCQKMSKGHWKFFKQFQTYIKMLRCWNMLEFQIVLWPVTRNQTSLSYEALQVAVWLTTWAASRAGTGARCFAGGAQSEAAAQCAMKLWM